MWLFDVFTWLYNLTPFTGALLLWFLVLVVTACVTTQCQSRRGQLWGFVVTSVGAVGILLYMETLTLGHTGKQLKGVVSNLVVMTLGGLGSGLLAVAISKGPTEADEEQARTYIRGRGLALFEYVFVFLLVCSLTLSAVCLLLRLLGWPVVTGQEVSGLLLVFLGASLGYAVTSSPRRLVKREQLGAGLLFVWLLFLVPVYGQALLGLIEGSWLAVLGFHLLVCGAVGWTVWRHRLDWRLA